MEQKKEIKISLKTAIIMVCIILAIVIIAIYFAINETDISKKSISDTVSVKTYNNKDYYIIEKDYTGNYDLQFLHLSEYYNSESDIKNTFEVKEVMSYGDYKSYCNKWGIKTKYSDTTKNYIVFSYLAYGSPNLSARLAAVEYKNNNVDLYIWDDASGVTGDISAYILVVPTNENINTINIVPLFSNAEYDNIQKYDTPYNPYELTSDKPIIYLYPEKETEITVKLGYPEKIKTSYPKYSLAGWKILAKPDGSLVDLDTGRNLYSLNWEGIETSSINMNEGFVVESKKIEKFLEEKLAILGLTEREAEEFIIYWLPKLQGNKYNYIRFATMKEINEYMPLEFSTKPDSVIRILMQFKGLNEKIEVEEQKLETPERTGFVAVEWGGTELK